MKKFLLPETGRFYKANLHCHSTISDGRLTPEEIKELYRSRGYSIVAYTDHDVYIRHPELADETFLPLYGYEMEVDEAGKPDYSLRRTCHMCFIARDPDVTEQVCWHRSKYLFGNAPKWRDRVRFDPAEPDYERRYTGECINDMMQRGRDHGFFVTYNHPNWSLESWPEYVRYEKMDAMEIFNNASCHGYQDYNPRAYDDLLRAGRRISCIAADDNHNGEDPSSPQFDSFGGFTVIKAEKLEYRTVMRALAAGHTYASQGPEIRALWFEDGRLHLECSPADHVDFTFGIRYAERTCSENGAPVTGASCAVPENCIYVRATVVDGHGKPANTNAYFADKLYA